MRALIALCADLGGKVLVHGSPRQRAIAPRQPKEDALAHATECFAEIASDAEEVGMTYCIESLAPPEAELINRVEEAAAIVDAIGSPVRTMIDTCAAARSERAPDPGADRALAAHRQDRPHPPERFEPPRARPGRSVLRPDPGCARAHRYAGICSVEPFVCEPDGPTCAARAIGYLQGLLEGLTAA
jgi:D-psicose/D-tagatose/L-ribulose 3-epimerase